MSRTASGVFTKFFFALALTVFAFATLSNCCDAAEPSKASPPASPEWRFQKRQELENLQSDLTASTSRTKLPRDRWADAQVFVKGATWALDFEPSLDAKGQALVDNAVKRARERMNLLAAGDVPWTKRRGRSIRGFVSAIDDSVQPYGLVVPARYNAAKPMRLDVVLHGSRHATGLGELQFMKDFDKGDVESPAAKGVAVAPVDYIEVHPLGRLGENAYRFEGETDVAEAIEAVCREYSIDRRRIVLRGGSLGGVGTWQLGLKRPDKFVALGPTAGPVDTIEFAASPWPHFVKLDPLTPWQRTMLHLVDAIDYAANGGMVPVVAAMGDKDHYFPSHLLMERAFQQEGVPFVGLIDHGAGHSVTSKVQKEQLRLIGEKAIHPVDPAPKHVRYVTWTLKFSRCFWIEVLGLSAHYERAEIDATLADNGSVVVKTPANITRFAIHPPALGSSSATVTIGGEPVPLPKSADGKQSLVFENQTGKWTCLGETRKVKLSGKRPGLQGPIDDAFATPFVCVRGDRQPWNATVGTWADASFNRFKYEWRRHYRGELPIANGRELTDATLKQRNLILFGDPGSNEWIEKLLPKLPLTWTRDEIRIGKQRFSAENHAVQLIFPSPFAEGRYVVLNSGHTYHDAELRFSYMVFPRLGDWAVTKVGENQPNAKSPNVLLSPPVAETVITSGFFNEAWSIP